ncbi:proprotein convertase P-domain-containing protein [Actinokineospora sp. HUAS TT18]|uniref:proprotein convertase P-domain-containing protein n=1 Tax=Actinokineospora sp. HUAS TT18 TaxID=3447451 RepID=UPI003F52767F
MSSALLATVATVSALIISLPAAAAPDQSQAQSAQAAAVSAADAYVRGNGARLLTSAQDEVVQASVTNGSNGLNYIAYERKHRGLPVVGGDFVVTTDASARVVSSAVAQDRVLDVATTPRISQDQARATAKRGLAKVDAEKSSRLVVLAWGTPKLAWEVVLEGRTDHGPSVMHVFVDALTGAVVDQVDDVKAGTGTGYYNGNVTIQTSGSGSSFSMTDSTRSGLRCGGQNGSAYTGTDDVWGNGSGTDLETACVDTLYAVQKQWDMLSAWLGRNGINGQGGGFPARVGLGDVNAYWNGSYTNFGHSQDNQRQVTPIDVVAHEFGHAIFQTTPGGAGSGNENGGLNESTGDIFGAVTEAFANNANDPFDYLVGEEVNLVGSGPIRNMYDPSQLQDPNCYSSSIPNTEVHAAAGPQNHWFYLLAEGSNPGGGKPNSPICSGGPASVTGIGVQNAAKIFYNGLLAKTSTWNHAKARVATLNAAKNLWPGDCTNFNVTKDAWNAISVPAQTGEPTCGTASNDFSVATSPSSGTIPAGGGSVNVTVNTTTTSGQAQSVALSASGLPSGVTAAFNPTSVTSGSSSQLTLTSTAAAAAGTYNITVTGTGSVTRTASYSLTIGGTSGGCTATNNTAVAIPDNNTVESSITVSGCAGNASATSTVPVDISHTYKGDLVVSLIAPDGSAYVLHNRAGGSADDIKQTFTVNLSGEVANGTWKLRVQDAASADTGTLNSWGVGLGGGTPPPTCGGSNNTAVAIPDNNTVESSIVVSGCTGNASATSTVPVDINHTYKGDLIVSLIAPDGSAYVLHNRAGGSADNIKQTFTVNLSGEAANGTWKLRVQDAASADTGTLNSWSLSL